MAEWLQLDFTWLDWALLGLYFGLIVILSIKKGWIQQDEEHFLLSGRKMTLPAFVATLVSTWYGGILGVGEYSYQFGVSQWLLFGVPFYIFSILFAWLLAGKIRMNPALSLPEAVGDFYGETTGRVSAVPIFVLVSPAPYILMLGLIFQYLSGGTGHFIYYAAAVAFFSVAYISFGGFSAVVRTDMLQVTLMFGGFVLLLWYANQSFGSPLKLWNAVPDVYRDLTGGRSIQYILVWFFIALWTFVDPSFHQRAAAAKTPKTAQRGILISVVLWTIFDFMTLFSGMYGWAILGEGLEKPVMTYPYLADVILPPGIKGLFFVALLATIMSTLDSYLFLSGQTLGRDLLVKLFPDTNRNTLTRISVLLAALLGILLIIVYPSVINLWYVIGSVMIPGLLIPVMGIYVKLFSLKKNYALPTMLVSTGVSLVWLVLGTIYSPQAYSQSFLGIEPFYPGLAVSIIFWLFGRSKSNDLMSAPEETPLQEVEVDGN